MFNSRAALSPFIESTMIVLKRSLVPGHGGDHSQSFMPSANPTPSSSPQEGVSLSAFSPTNNIDLRRLIGNFAPVARIMKTALPENAKIAKEAKECMQECVSEFISFITSEGQYIHHPLRPHYLLSPWDGRGAGGKGAKLDQADLRDRSVREVPTGETQDGQRRRCLVCHELFGI